ncbi:ricin B-like lectin R40G2 [Oryza brachyantha]|uniref:ricin B-like lectin R40G2 n=1 Tax=Oryza brachyantha TaxID=4533 RepID=UPI001ADB2C0A|nr:ricin B-like lectin R40G2 [Oryza brachyantha]
MANTIRIQCRASDELSLTLVNGEVILTRADPRDDRQVWYKNVTYSAGLKDEAGRPAFALVNKAIGYALKHSFGYNHPVRAVKFEPCYLDESVLWTESESHDVRVGFRRIHMINNADYIFDAEDPKCDGARDGTRLILFRWHGGDNQLWRMAPCTEQAPDHGPPVRVVCQRDKNLCLTVRDGAVELARVDREDPKQQWIVSFRNTGRVTDGEGHRSFALVNRSTGKAMKRSGDKEPVELVGHSPDSVDVALLWTRSDDLSGGFHCLRTVRDVDLVLDAAEGVPGSGKAQDGTPITVFPWNGGSNKKWAMFPLH